MQRELMYTLLRVIVRQYIFPEEKPSMMTTLGITLGNDINLLRFCFIKF